MGHQGSREQEREIKRLRQEVVEAKVRSMIAEIQLHHALKALEGQAETLDLVTRNVALMLTTISGGTESERTHPT